MVGTLLFYEGNTKTELCQAWGNWLDRLSDWNWYATFTFRDPPSNKHRWTKPGWNYAQRALTAWDNALGDACFGGKQPRWVACMEYQSWRGVPHWHLLVSNVPESQRRMSWVDWWFDHYGIARILPFDRNLGAGFYLSKYLTKQLADIRFAPGLKVDKFVEGKSGT